MLWGCHNTIYLVLLQLWTCCMLWYGRVGDIWVFICFAWLFWICWVCLHNQNQIPFKIGSQRLGLHQMGPPLEGPPWALSCYWASGKSHLWSEPEERSIQTGLLLFFQVTSIKPFYHVLKGGLWECCQLKDIILRPRETVNTEIR